MYLKFLIVVLFLFNFFDKISSDDNGTCTIYNSIKVLKDKVLCNYNKDEMPRKTSVLVSLQLLLKYFEYDNYSHIFKVTAWLLMVWRDRRLRFSSAQYGTKYFYVDSSKIWTLDLQLYDAPGDSARSLSPTTCVVHSVGRVACLFPTTHEALCHPDMTNWPYDKQNCDVNYVGWMKPKGRAILQLTKPFVRLSSYRKNPEWALTRYANRKYTLKSYPGLANYSFPVVNLNFTIQRHSKMRSCTLIIPHIVLMVFTLIILEFDPNTYERFIVMAVNVANHLWNLLRFLFDIPIMYNTPPSVLYFTSGSFFVTVFIIFETMILRKWIEEKSKCGNIVLKIGCFLENTIIGRVLFINGISVNSEDNATTTTIENFDKNQLVKVYKVVDRLYFILLCGIYVYLFKAFIPVPDKGFSWY